MEDVDNMAPSTTTEVVMTEEEFDLRHHQQLHSQKNFDTVIFDTWKIKPWYVFLYQIAPWRDAKELMPPLCYEGTFRLIH